MHAAVPLLKDVMNDQICSDIYWLIGHQASFNDETLGKRKINCLEIKELDHVSAVTNSSLRDMIMGIPQLDNPERSLFHTVNHLRFNWSTVVFTCMPAVESEARNMVSCLLPFLKHHYGDSVCEFFTKEAQLRSATSFWDKTEQCICNEDDIHVSGLKDIDDDFVFPPGKKTKISTNLTAPERPIPTQALQCNTFGEDADSIQTFRRNNTPTDDEFTVSSHLSDSAMSVDTLCSRLLAAETLLKQNNIALPASSATAHPSLAEESGHN